MTKLRNAYQESASSLLQIKDEQNKFVQEFLLPADFIGFAGHFPEKPVLPAVIQLALVRFMAENVTGVKLQLHECKKAKFNGVILPNQPCRTVLTIFKDGDFWQGSFILYRQEDPVSQGNCHWQEIGEE